MEFLNVHFSVHPAVTLPSSFIGPISFLLSLFSVSLVHKTLQVSVYCTVVSRMLGTGKIRKSERQKHKKVELCKWINLLIKYGRRISVDVVTKIWGYTSEVWRFDYSRGVRNFSSPKRPDRLWSQHRLVPEAVSPAIKLRVAPNWLLTHSGIEIKNMWRYTSTSSTSFWRCV